LLDLMVFGKRAGRTAAARAKTISQGKLTMEHLSRFRAEATSHGVSSELISPMLFPAYTKKE
jgi:hypothetical protein